MTRTPQAPAEPENELGGAAVLDTLTGAIRIQRKRTRGWRMPEGAIFVGRPSRYGNPFIISEHQTREQVVDNFRQALHDGRLQISVARVRRELAGRDLACWCRLTDKHGDPVPCHADVLLEVANSDD